MDGRLLGFDASLLGTLIVVGGALAMVSLQSLLYMFNRYASGGYGRFLVPAAPWMAICATVGLQQLWSVAFSGGGDQEVQGNWRTSPLLHIALSLTIGVALSHWMQRLQWWPFEPLLAISFGTLGLVVVTNLRKIRRATAFLLYAVLVATCGIWWGIPFGPLRLTDNQQAAARAARWVRHDPERSARPVATSDFWVRYFLERPVVAWTDLPPTGLLIYSRKYGAAGFTEADLPGLPLHLLHVEQSADPTPLPPSEIPAIRVFEKLAVSNLNDETADD